MDVSSIRAQFPILQRQVHGHPLAYLDNAATTQKPQVVLDAIGEYYANHNANVHRGVHTLGDESTTLYHQSRQRIAEFFGATADELVLTRNTTEAINLLSLSLQKHLGSGVVATTLIEHHSNFVPWQRRAYENDGELLVLPLTGDGYLDTEQAYEQLSHQRDRVKVIALTHLSNALGVHMPVKEIVGWLKEWGIRDQVFVVVDVAQSAAHEPLSLSDLGADALVFSGHKMYGPMGVGGLVVRRAWLEQLDPVLWGGGMIDQVSIENTTYSPDIQDRFAAGTPDVAGAVALAAALTWLKQFSWSEIQQHEKELLLQAEAVIAQHPEFQQVGPAVLGGIIPPGVGSFRNDSSYQQRFGSLAFIHQSVHAHDVAQLLDRYGVAVRSGHHCTMPLHSQFQWQATTRLSVGIYNNSADIEQFAQGIQHVSHIFG